MNVAYPSIYLQPVKGTPFRQNLLLHSVYHSESPFPGMKPANNAYFIWLVEMDSEEEVIRVIQEDIFLAKTPFLHIFERGHQCL